MKSTTITTITMALLATFIAGCEKSATITMNEQMYIDNLCEWAEKDKPLKQYLEYGFNQYYSSESDCVEKFTAILKTATGSEAEQHKKRDAVISAARTVDINKRGYEKAKRFSTYLK